MTVTAALPAVAILARARHRAWPHDELLEQGVTVFRGPRWLLGIVATSVALLTGCGDGGGGEATPAPSSITVPVPVEEVTLSGAVRRILGPHALELGDAPTLVIVLDGVPPSVRSGSEVQATGSVEVFGEGLGAELGIPLDDLNVERFEGIECLVVAQLEVLDPP